MIDMNDAKEKVMLDMKVARDIVAAFQELLDKTPERATGVRVVPDDPGSWTLGEIVGHLIDSAANNHLRFCRLRMGNLENFPGHEAEPWVRAQDYQACDFGTLSRLWAGYNELLLFLTATTPATALANEWIRPEGSQTLESSISGYYGHLRLHTEHYAKRLEEVMTILD